LDRENGLNIYKTQDGQTVTDYGLLSYNFLGFTDKANKLIWSGALPKHVRPTGLDPDKEWWLSDTDAGGLRDSQPFANRQPAGFTDENGYFVPYAAFLIEQFQPRKGREIYTVVAANGEDVSLRLRKAMRRYPSVKLSVPKGVTASISHSRIDVLNRVLHVEVHGTLNCTHRVKQSPYLNSGDWYQISQFSLGAGGSLYFTGTGNINHNISDVGAKNLAPYHCGFVTGNPYQQSRSPVPGTVSVPAHHLNFYLSTAFFNHDGGGTDYVVSAMGCQFYKISNSLASVPKLITKGSWSFGAGSVTLTTASVSFYNSIARGTSGNADGTFAWSGMDARNPSYYY
jgi:hypothetical protein